MDPDAREATVVFSKDWLAVEAIYGGHVVSRLIAALDDLPGYEVRAVTVHFFGSVRAGEATVSTEVEHRGSTTATVSARLRQGHQRALAVAKLATGGDEGMAESIDLDGLRGPDEVEIAAASYGRLPYEEFIESRALPGGSEEGPMPGASRAWVRLRQGGDLSVPVAAPLLLDALVPGAYSIPPVPSNVPTVEFSVHVTPGEVRATSWHLATQSLIWASADLCVEESALYDAAGTVVAKARQTRRVLHS